MKDKQADINRLHKEIINNPEFFDWMKDLKPIKDYHIKTKKKASQNRLLIGGKDD